MEGASLTLEDHPNVFLFLTDRKGLIQQEAHIRDLAKWAGQNGWTVEDDAKGYTRFFDHDGHYVAHYPATPSNPRNSSDQRDERRQSEYDVGSHHDSEGNSF